MKTFQFINNKTNFLITLIIFSLFPTLAKAQLSVTTSNYVGINTTTPSRKLVVSNASAGGTEIHPFTGYNQIISYNRSTSAYMPMILQDVASTGTVGIGTTSPTLGYRLDVNGATYINGASYLNGNVTVIGSGTYTGTWTTSDQMFKTHIDSIQDALTIIAQLKPKTYYFDTVAFSAFHFEPTKQYGFIAQELEQVLPQLVKSNTKLADHDTLGNVTSPEVNYKAVNYTELIGILTKGIQEQESKIENLSRTVRSADTTQNNNDQSEVIDRLKKSLNQQQALINSQDARLNDLQNQIAICCNKNQQSNNATGTLNSSESESATSATLFQNVPNPFDKQTSIQYFIPTNAQSASLMVFDLNGKLISELPVTNFGKSSIIINGSELSPGMFVYSLIVNGKIIDTKRMILTH